MNPEDRERVIVLLQDPTRSYRSIGRELGVSDWTIRRIARELDGDPRPMKQRHSRFEEPAAEGDSLVSGWLVCGIIAAGFVLMLWAGARGVPPPEL